VGHGETRYSLPVSNLPTPRIAVVHGVVRALADALKHHSQNELPEKLNLDAVYYFGSLRKAKAAVKTDRRLRTGWSTTTIIAAIRERQRSGKPLGYAAVRQDEPALVSAAEAYFGGWVTSILLGSNCIFAVSGGNEQCPKKIVSAMQLI
jgi:hypothetical protein